MLSNSGREKKKHNCRHSTEYCSQFSSQRSLRLEGLENYTVYKCNVGCKPTAHFHCPSCKRLLERRDRFVDHLGQCVQQAVEEEQEAQEQQEEQQEEEQQQQQQQQEAKEPLSMMHITIQIGQSLPDIERCSTCCNNYHCPFCSSTFFRPTKLSKVHVHLDSHFTRAVVHEGYTIHRCGLGCRPQLHYHCINCQSMLVRKADFVKHLAICRKRQLAVPLPPSPSPPTSVAAPSPWPSSSPHSRPISLAQLMIKDLPLEPRLPLSCLHLLVPPLRLMSACMWQVAQERNVDQYDKLAEFITLVIEMVPELLNYKQKAQLILGLKARLILEVIKRTDVDCKAIQDHLLSFQQRMTEDQDGEVEMSKSAFVELVQTLLADQSEKEIFFKEVYSVQYGARFDTALQILVWEFFYQLEELLPVPSFSQVFSMFDVSSHDCEFEQFVSDPQDLRRILQRQQKRQKLTKSEFTFMSDTILSTLASKQTSAAFQDHAYQKIDDQDGDRKPEGRNQEKPQSKDDEETDDSSIETNPDTRLQERGLSPLTSSPCSEEAGVVDDGETAGEAAVQPPRCSESSAEGVEEHLDLRINKEPSEENTIQSSAGDRADVSLPFSEDSLSASENTCLECGETFARRSSLKKHYLVHPLARPFKCTQCDKAYKYNKDLKQHLRNHFNPKILAFACSVCGKRFNSQALLTVHMRHHSGERPYACSYCDKRFLTKPVLTTHVRLHTGERPYACKFCDKTFTQLYPRTVHQRTHNKEKPYLCSTCGMSFSGSGALLVHTRTHTGERPHRCDLCGKRFATAIQLTVHRRFHTGERPYPCSHCDKSFHSSTGLKKHMRTHTGEKPYKCITCHKTFSQRSNMRIHLKVHKNL